MRPRRRDPIEAAQVRCQRRRQHARRAGRWDTDQAVGQLTDLLALAAAGVVVTADDRDADVAEHTELARLLGARAGAYRAVHDELQRTAQEVAP